MNKENNTSVCPVEYAGGLDNYIRRLLQNPYKILKPYINEDMTVLDLGCGPGFFSLEIAKMLNNTGKVIAADLQQGMLDKVFKKIRGNELEQRIYLHKCREESTGITEKVDLVLAFYMIHEVPDHDKLFREMISILKPRGKILIIEPKFHVSKKSFIKMIDRAGKTGFVSMAGPNVLLSRSVVLTKKISN